MDLLAFLATTGGRVVTKDEIIDAVWQGRFIADATLTRTIADLRRVLGDHQRTHQYIETIPKRGYRFVMPILVAADAPGPGFMPAVRSRPDGERGAGEGRIADRLASARLTRFVGRAAEIEMVRSALLADELPFVSLHLTGEGGVGKTTLIGELARVAASLDRVVLWIDGRNIEASPTGFLVALSQAIGSERVDLPAVVERLPDRALLLIDTYELLAPLDDWLRHSLLPQLPPRPWWSSPGAASRRRRGGPMSPGRR
jgi:hypothetical protein